MQTQPLLSKIGEVKYRSKIVRQQLGENTEVKDEPTAQEFKNILEEKLKTTEQIFKNLKRKGIAISPFLEIGSEHCLRPALLINKFGANGIASDISLYSLAKASKFSKQFNFKKVPKTICADAENLPFAKNSFPFVFVYESLHHFPEPKIPLQEIHRVLKPGGVCLVGDDPITQTFKVKLWSRPNKLRLWEKILKLVLILPFISHIGKNEVEYNILEGDFPLDIWENALSIFEKVEAEIKVFPFGPSEKITKLKSKNWLSPSLRVRIPLFFLGGGISALCFKSGKLSSTNQNLESALICPTCHLKKKREIAVKKQRGRFICESCKSEYREKFGVPILVENSLKSKIINV